MKKERKIIIAIIYNEIEASEPYERITYLADFDKYCSESICCEEDISYKGIDLTPVENKDHAYLFNESELADVKNIIEDIESYGIFNPYYVESYYTYV
jgi:hypothetical protein